MQLNFKKFLNAICLFTRMHLNASHWNFLWMLVYSLYKYVRRNCETRLLSIHKQKFLFNFCVFICATDEGHSFSHHKSCSIKTDICEKYCSTIRAVFSFVTFRHMRSNACNCIFSLKLRGMHCACVIKF